MPNLHYVLATVARPKNVVRHFCSPFEYITMSDKHKQPKYQQSMPGKPSGLDQNQAARRRGIEPEEQHREGGNRVPDQGGKKPGEAKH